MSTSEEDAAAELKRLIEELRKEQGELKKEQGELKKQNAELLKSVSVLQKRSECGEEEMTTSTSSSTAPNKKYRPNMEELQEEIRIAIRAIPIEDLKVKLIPNPTREAIVSNLPKCTVTTS